MGVMLILLLPLPQIEVQPPWDVLPVLPQRQKLQSKDAEGIVEIAAELSPLYPGR